MSEVTIAANTDTERHWDEIPSMSMCTQSVLLLAGVGTFNYDPHQKTLLTTTDLDSLYGLPKGHFPLDLEEWLEFIHPEDAYRFESALHEASCGKKPYDTEFRIIAADGSTRWVLARGQLQQTPEGGRVLAGVNIDITSKKEADESVSLALNAGEVGIWDLDLRSGLIQRSAKYDQIFGYKQMRPSWRWDDIFHHVSNESRELVQSAFDQALKDSSIDFDLQIRRIDGQTRWINLSGRVYYDLSDYPVRVAGTIRDITKVKSVIEEYRRAKVLAEEASTTKTRFVANMSHEIRTPLGAMLGYTDLALDAVGAVSGTGGGAANGTEGESSDSSKEVHESLLAIRRNGQQLMKIIGDVLDLSKVEADRIEVENIRFSVLDLTQELCNALRVQARKSNIQVEFKTEGWVPEFLRTDPTRLRQILNNLLSNSIKFTKEGFVRLTLSSLPAETPERRKIQFLVEDSGVGLDDEQKRRLFQPFSQADASTSRRFGGTGLGLVISRQLAKAMGGELSLIKSELGKGSSFEVLIEVDVCESIEASRAEVAIPVSHPDLIRDVRVLLVDDSSDNQVIVSRYLKAMGAKVELASNGQEGVEKALKNHYDVVLMDIQMPVKDGYQAARELRAQGCEFPIVALSANVFRFEREHAFDAGFIDYLTKPVDRRRLIETVSRVTLN